MSKMIYLLVVLLSCVCTQLSAEQTKQFNISKGDSNVKPLESCGSDGTCFYVDLQAPGPITSVSFSCEGQACGWVHACPDGGNCNLHANEYEITGSTARWYGWTNSGNPRAVYKYVIHYQ